MKPTLLLHTCCAPCSIIPLKDLLSEFDVTGFFYNPNIHPFREYIKRKEATFHLVNDFHIKMIYGDYPYRLFLEKTLPYSTSIKRCSICYSDRLTELSNRAKLGNFQYCSSTLFFSPYQNHKIIMHEAKKIFVDNTFVYRNWSLKYKEGMQEARDRDYY
ncbi:MAG: epoxyqueuosine reductase QueH, partial [Caldisericia bacterium]|nr:epoxyqueuosine reductase QueH [Caldisericia bacterium]